MKKTHSLPSICPFLENERGLTRWQVLYIVPVPLDAATIGDAVICCPLVIKRDGDSLVCSILANATTDRKAIPRGQSSPAIPEAIRRAEFTILQPTAATRGKYYQYSN